MWKGAHGQAETHNPQTQQQIMPGCIALYMQKGTDFTARQATQTAALSSEHKCSRLFSFNLGGGWGCWRRLLFKCLNTYESTWSPWFRVMQPISVGRRVKCHLPQVAPALVEYRTMATPHGPSPHPGIKPCMSYSLLPISTVSERTSKR